MSNEEKVESPLTALEATVRILSIDSALRDLNEQRDVLKRERQEIIVAQGAAIATMKIGDEVNIPYGYGRNKSQRRYRVTRIAGRFWSPRRIIEDARLEGATDEELSKLSEGEFESEYYGRQVKADGSLSDKEKKLYQYTPVAAPPKQSIQRGE